MAVRAESTNEPQSQQFVDPLNGKSYNRASFADEVRGNEAKPLDFTLLKLMQDSYQSHVPGRPSVDGWTPLTDQQLRQVGIDPKLLTDKKSGFDAAIYGDGDGRYFVAFRGTDQGKDWKTNLGQGLGFETAQYNQALQLGMQAKAAFGEQVAFGGHSLGAGLTTTAIIGTGSPGIVANGAGLSDKTIERLGLDPDAVRKEVENGQIRNYQVKGEILTHLQEKNLATRFVMPDAMGHDMPLPDPHPLKGFHNINPFEKVPHRVDLHSMDSVLQAWQMKHGNLLNADRQTQSAAELGSIANPATPRFNQVDGQLGPQLQALGLNPEQSRTVSADLALQTLRDGNAPTMVAVGTDQQRAFAIPQNDVKPYSSVVIAESKEKNFADISQKASELVAANPQLVAANPNQNRDQPGAPAPEQANPDIGGQSVARGGR
jgi:Protein of unknown function (DUF2974)